MYKTTVTVHNWEAFFLIQGVTSWQNFSAQTHRPEYHCETTAPPHTPDSGSEVRFAMVTSLFTSLVWQKF